MKTKTPVTRKSIFLLQRQFNRTGISQIKISNSVRVLKTGLPTNGWAIWDDESFETQVPVYQRMKEAIQAAKQLVEERADV
jgi:hypothetical protein